MGRGLTVHRGKVGWRALPATARMCGKRCCRLGCHAYGLAVAGGPAPIARKVQRVRQHVSQRFNSIPQYQTIMPGLGHRGNLAAALSGPGCLLIRTTLHATRLAGRLVRAAKVCRMLQHGRQGWCSGWRSSTAIGTLYWCRMGTRFPSWQQRSCKRRWARTGSTACPTAACCASDETCLRPQVTNRETGSSVTRCRTFDWHKKCRGGSVRQRAAEPY